jgi:xanthine/uracil permease
VLGAAGMVMFGMVTLMGVRILSTVDFEKSRYNLLIAATSVGIGMIPMVSPMYFHHLPEWSRVFTESGIILSVFTALILNLLFNGPTKPDEAEAGAARSAVLGES